MTSNQRWLTLRLEIVLEQARMLRHLADTSGDTRFLEVANSLRTVVEDACRDCGLTKKEKR